MPTMLMPSWASGPADLVGAPTTASPRARLPAAGTVVTLMKTPTMVAVFWIARASAPAAPATSATMNDHLSGCQMKPVLGRGWVIISGVIKPSARAEQGQHRHHRDGERERQHQQPQAAPDQAPAAAARSRRDAAATAANSGPTTIAPTTSTAESVITAIAARITASTRKIR